MVLKKVYISNYRPDKAFFEKIPFKNFVAIRGEFIKAHYIPIDTQSIVPELFKIFTSYYPTLYQSKEILRYIVKK